MNYLFMLPIINPRIIFFHFVIYWRNYRLSAEVIDNLWYGFLIFSNGWIEDDFICSVVETIIRSIQTVNSATYWQWNKYVCNNTFYNIKKTWIWICWGIDISYYQFIQKCSYFWKFVIIEQPIIVTNFLASKISTLTKITVRVQQSKNKSLLSCHK